MKKLVLFFTLLASASSHAQETAAMLPKGIFRFRIVDVVTSSINSNYDNSGNPLPLLSPLNRTLTAGYQAAQNPQLKQLYDKLNQFQSGLGDALYQTNLTTQSSINEQQKVFALEYGITDRLAFGVIVPRITQNIHASIQANVTSNVSQIRALTQGMTPIQNGLDQFAAQIPSSADYSNMIFTQKGYQIPHDSVVNGLGDIQAGFKYQPINTESLLFAWQAGFQLPTTTHTQDFTNLIDQGVGTKTFAFGAQFFMDYLPTNSWVLAGMAKFGLPFTDHQYRPVGKFGYQAQGLIDLTDPTNFDNTSRHLGNELDTELSTTYYLLNKTVNFYGCYQYSVKGADTYSGDNAALDYGSLSDNTAFSAHKYELGVGYSTIPFYYSKKFPLPFEVRVGYNHMFMGYNTPLVSYMRYNLLLYF